MNDIAALAARIEQLEREIRRRDQARPRGVLNTENIGNLVQNGNFEQGTIGWASVEITPSTLSSLTTDVIDGDRKLFIGGSAMSAGCRAFPVTPGATYQVSLWIKGAAATASGLYIRAFHRATYPDGGYVTGFNYGTYVDFVSNGPVPSAWTRYTFYHAPGASDRWMTLAVYNYTGGPAGGLSVDAASVTEFPLLDSGWVGITEVDANFSTYLCAVRRVGKVVYLRLNLTTTVARAVYAQIGTIPAGYRPLAGVPMAAAGRFVDTVEDAGTVFADSTGNVQLLRALAAGGTMQINTAVYLTD